MTKTRTKPLIGKRQGATTVQRHRDNLRNGKGIPNLKKQETRSRFYAERRAVFKFKLWINLGDSLQTMPQRTEGRWIDPLLIDPQCLKGLSGPSARVSKTTLQDQKFKRDVNRLVRAPFASWVHVQTNVT